MLHVWFEPGNRGKIKAVDQLTIFDSLAQVVLSAGGYGVVTFGRVARVASYTRSALSQILRNNTCAYRRMCEYGVPDGINRRPKYTPK